MYHHVSPSYEEAKRRFDAALGMKSVEAELTELTGEILTCKKCGGTCDKYNIFDGYRCENDHE